MTCRGDGWTSSQVKVVAIAVRDRHGCAGCFSLRGTDLGGWLSSPLASLVAHGWYRSARGGRYGDPADA